MDRIENLRSVALARSHSNDEFNLLFYKRYSDSTEKSEYARYSDAFYYALSNLVPHVTDGELVVGELSGRLTDSQREEWESRYKGIAEERCRAAGGGQDSHMAVDFELLLSDGINGIIRRIDGYLTDSVSEKRDFYLAAKTCLEAVIVHSMNYALHIESLAAQQADEKRRAELYRIAHICRRVPAEPATSFYEAVQSVHFLCHSLSFNPYRPCFQLFQLGHPDRYLYPYYKRDIESGAITDGEAQLLLDCLGVQINMRVPTGLSCGYMVGGRDEAGNIVANELTEMLMRVVDNVRLVYPAVGLCYTEDMPEKYLDLACRLLLDGRSHPAIFNDDIITEGLVGYGVPEPEAHSYIHSTCVEITPVASSNVWVASPYTNLAQLLLDTMDREYSSFEEHLSVLIDSLDRRIRDNSEAQNAIRRQRAENSINPLLSCFVNDCLTRGLDIERGGARYNWIMPSFVGMGNLVDSLYVLKQLIYDEKRYTVRAFKEILDSDFAGYESLRGYILDSIPKYGNDIDEVDTYYGMIVDHIVSECKKYDALYFGGRLIPSAFCWVKHELFGRATGATPDGRKAGFPLGDGSGPCQGREMCGPTASILSSTKWDHRGLIGGVAVNMKFTRGSLGAHSVEILQSLVRTYIRRGGFEMQINVVDRDTLERARQRPEEYRDLVVRIGGYSDYFVRLSPKMQEEVILRTEHRI
jgi:formate C-acetyltransferase